MNFVFAARYVAVFVFLVITAAVSASPDRVVRAVQCGSFDSEADAALCESRLGTIGYGPVWRQHLDGTFKVLVGRCATLAEVTLLKNDLRENGFPDAFSTAWPLAEGEDLNPGVTTPSDPLLLPGKGKKRITVSKTTTDEMSPDMREFERALSSSDPELTILTGQILIAQLGDTDAAKGRAMVKVGRAMVGQEKKAARALPYFLKVARGEVAASEEAVLESRWLAADSWHYYYFDPLKAFAAYKEILSEHGVDPKVEARARVEMVACLLELAQMEKATFPEVRKAARDLHHNVPPGFKRAHAVADLMAGESYAIEGNPNKALEILENFADLHPGQKREIMMATNWAAFIYGEKGDWEKCRHLYEQVVSMELTESERFYWQGRLMDIQGNAPKWMAHFAKKFNDTERKEQYERMIEQYEAPQQAAHQTWSEGELDIAFPHKWYEVEK